MSEPLLSPRPTRFPWLIAIVLILVCAIVRIPNLLSLPIFGDEAIYLRWAQLIRNGHPWVSLVDPKPPLHFWLIAAFYNWANDPLTPARMISVASSLLLIPATLLFCGELDHLSNRTPATPGKSVGLLAAVLTIFTPFLAFYGRLATADALFLTESTLAIALSLRWANRLAAGQSAIPTALLLSLVMAAAMNTRQGLSLTLWAMPVAAIALHAFPAGKAARQELLLNAFFHIFGMLAIALLLFLPFLFADLNNFIIERGGGSLWHEIKIRILYQERFSSSDGGRLALITRNGLRSFAPFAWLWTYLTPGIYLASFLGLLFRLLKRQWSVAIILFLWIAILLAPPIVLGSVLRSRYLLAGSMPLLIAAAFFVVDILTAFLVLPTAAFWTGALLLCGGLLIPSLHDTAILNTRWQNQYLLPDDRDAYLTGWTNGLASRKAIEFIKGFAKEHPIIVLTDGGWGLPADAAWVYLSTIPNVTIYYVTPPYGSPLLQPAPSGAPNTFMLRSNKWLYTPAAPVHLPSDAPIVYLTNDPIQTRFGPVPAQEGLTPIAPNLRLVQSFYGIDPRGDHVTLFEITPR